MSTTTTLNAQNIIDTITADLTAQTTVIGGAVTFMQGIVTAYAQAKQAALGAGATQAQLAAFDAVDAKFRANTDALSQALVKGTAAETEANNPTALPGSDTVPGGSDTVPSGSDTVTSGTDTVPGGTATVPGG